MRRGSNLELPCPTNPPCPSHANPSDNRMRAGTCSPPFSRSRVGPSTNCGQNVKRGFFVTWAFFATRGNLGQVGPKLRQQIRPAVVRRRAVRDESLQGCGSTAATSFVPSWQSPPPSASPSKTEGSAIDLVRSQLRSQCDEIRTYELLCPSNEPPALRTQPDRRPSACKACSTPQPLQGSRYFHLRAAWSSHVRFTSTGVFLDRCRALPV
jgi:hypothetical protein